jgi:hypothetical protein
MRSLVTAGRVVMVVGVSIALAGVVGCARESEVEHWMAPSQSEITGGSQPDAEAKARQPDVAEIQRRVRLEQWQVQLLNQTRAMENGVPMRVEAPGGWVQPGGQITFTVPLSGKNPDALVVKFLDLASNAEVDDHDFVMPPKIDRWGNAYQDGFDVTFVLKKDLANAQSHHPVYFRVYMQDRKAVCKEGAFVIQKEEKKPAGNCP